MGKSTIVLFQPLDQDEGSVERKGPVELIFFVLLLSGFSEQIAGAFQELLFNWLTWIPVELP